MSTHQDELQNRAIGDYLDALASDSTAPGGGSVAGMVTALAAGLGEMVVSLTRDADPAVTAAGSRLTDLRTSALASGAADEMAYSGYVRSTRMPRSTEEEKARRRAKMQDAIQESTAVPLELARTAVLILEQLDPIVRLGNRYVISDAAAAISLCIATVEICMINVDSNLPLIRDTQVAESLRTTARATEQRARALADQLRAQFAART